MKVSDLIHLLEQQDPDALVVVSGYEAGLDDQISVILAHIEFNRYGDEYWYGRHEVTEDEGSAVAVWIKGCRRYETDR